MRKYSCQVISIFQQYSTLLEAHPKVAKAIIGNSSSMLLLGNHNRADLDTLSGFIPKPGLPEVIKDQITRFPKPAELRPEEAYAGFVYLQLDGAKPHFTVGRNVISQEVEDITSSSGDVFERKQKELKSSIRKQETLARGNGDHALDGRRVTAPHQSYANQ
jgi:hypothetical protein